MPARSNASQAVSSSSRCCGSMARASRGLMPKKVGVELGRRRGGIRPRGRRSCRRGRGRGRRGRRGPSRGRRGTPRSRRAPSATSCHRSSGVVDAAGVAAAHADDRDRLVVRRPRGRGRCRGRGRAAVASAPARVPISSPGGGRQGARGWGGRRRSVAGSRRPVAAPRRLRSSTAVSESKPSSLKDRCRVDGGRRRVAEDGGDLAADEVEQHVGAVRPRAARPGARARGVRRGAAPGRRRAGARAADQAAQQRRAARPTRRRARSAAQVERGRGRAAVARSAEGGVEAARGLVGGQRRPVPRGPCGRGRRRSRVPVMPPSLGPQAPGQGGGGQPVAAAVLGERVEEGVGGGVVGLAGAAEDAGDGGEQDERGEVEVPGQLVQVPGGVDLGAQDRVEPLGGRARRARRRRGRRRCGRRRSSGWSAGTSASSAARASRSATSQAATVTSAPSAVSSVASSAAPGASGPRRLVSSRWRTPCWVTRWRATSAPSAPVPPVISTVPSRRMPRRASRRRVRAPATARGAGTSSAPSRTASCGSPEARAAGRPRREAVAVVEVDEDEPVGVLGLGGADQAPDGARGQVGTSVAGVGGDGAAGDDDQPGVGEPLVGQPVLEQGQRVRRGVAARPGRRRRRGRGDRATTGPAGPHRRERRARAREVRRTSRGAERGQRRGDQPVAGRRPRPTAGSAAAAASVARRPAPVHRGRARRRGGRAPRRAARRRPGAATSESTVSDGRAGGVGDRAATTASGAGGREPDAQGAWRRSRAAATPLQENGSRRVPSSASPAPASAAACSAASSSAGCRPNAARRRRARRAGRPRRRLSSPRRQAARRPWKAGP